MEHVGFDPGVIHFNIHTAKYNHAAGTNKGDRMAVADASEAFHVYPSSGTPGRSTSSSTPRRRSATATREPAGMPGPTTGDISILNLAIGGDWGGQKGIDDRIFPQRTSSTMSASINDPRMRRRRAGRRVGTGGSVAVIRTRGMNDQPDVSPRARDPGRGISMMMVHRREALIRMGVTALFPGMLGAMDPRRLGIPGGDGREAGDRSPDPVQHAGGRPHPGRPPGLPARQSLARRRLGWPLHPNSRKIIASIGADKPFRYNPDMGFVLVPPDQRRVPIRLIGYNEESDKGPYPVPDDMPIEGWPACTRAIRSSAA